MDAMLKKTIIGFMLALFAGPLSAHAEMPGQPCTAAQIGTTKMADDKQNIIACLLTGKAAPENVQEWKAMTSSGGGVLTGGCMRSCVSSNKVTKCANNTIWGSGCSSNCRGYYCTPADSITVGYECGYSFFTSSDSGDYGAILCIKK